MKPLTRAIALSLALSAFPACATLNRTQIGAENPFAAARTDEQRAYALIETYAAFLEEATDLIKRDDVPLAIKQAIGRAEATATPSMDLLRIALSTYLRARADYTLAKDKPQLERATALLAIAGLRLREAEKTARASLHELQTQLAAARQRKA
jgi:hypothetical protein